MQKKFIAICILIIFSAQTNAAGSTGKVRDLADGGLAKVFKGHDGGEIDLDLGTIRKIDDKYIATWFTMSDNKVTRFYTSEFDCDQRQSKLLQSADANARLVPHSKESYLVMPKSDEEIIMDYVCPAWWEFWK